MCLSALVAPRGTFCAIDFGRFARKLVHVSAADPNVVPGAGPGTDFENGIEGIA